MGDLVTRLREDAEISGWKPIMSEAADEIERLQAAQQWQPIDEKARASGWILVDAPEMFGEPAKRGWITYTQYGMRYLEPESWMPLPPPPKQE